MVIYVLRLWYKVEFVKALKIGSTSTIKVEFEDPTGVAETFIARDIGAMYLALV